MTSRGPMPPYLIASLCLAGTCVLVIALMVITPIRRALLRCVFPPEPLPPSAQHQHHGRNPSKERERMQTRPTNAVPTPTFANPVPPYAWADAGGDRDVGWGRGERYAGAHPVMPQRVQTRQVHQGTVRRYEPGAYYHV